MDKIQKTLIKAGHKDLAQEYFNKVAGKEESSLREIQKNLNDIKKIKIIDKGVISAHERNIKVFKELVDNIKNFEKKYSSLVDPRYPEPELLENFKRDLSNNISSFRNSLKGWIDKRQEVLRGFWKYPIDEKILNKFLRFYRYAEAMRKEAENLYDLTNFKLKFK